MYSCFPVASPSFFGAMIDMAVMMTMFLEIDKLICDLEVYYAAVIS